MPAVNTDLNPYLATDLALQLRPLDVIRAQYGLTPAELRTLLHDPTFRQMVREAKARWCADMNAEQRVRAKAALAVEDTIADLHAIVVNPEQKANYRADAFAKLARVAQLDGSPQPGASGSNFHISINIPDVANARTETARVSNPHLPTREMVIIDHDSPQTIPEESAA